VGGLGLLPLSVVSPKLFAFLNLNVTCSEVAEASGGEGDVSPEELFAASSSTSVRSVVRRLRRTGVVSEGTERESGDVRFGSSRNLLSLFRASDEIDE